VATFGRASLVDEYPNLCLVGDVADDSERLMARRRQRVGRVTEWILADVPQHDARTLLGEGAR
jgi:hypothetical protein